MIQRGKALAISALIFKMVAVLAAALSATDQAKAEVDDFCDSSSEKTEAS